MSEAMAEVRRQCSHTHNAGHALLLILLCQRLMSEWNRDVRSHKKPVPSIPPVKMCSWVLQWNLSIMDTLGTSHFVLYRVVVLSL